MTINSATSLVLDRGHTGADFGRAVDRTVAPPVAADRAAAARAALSERRQVRGKRLIFGGFAITILGVIGYCAVCFAGGSNADVDDMLMRNAHPFAQATLGVLGLGTLLWLVGSFTYLIGAMDAEETPAGDDTDGSSDTPSVIGALEDADENPRAARPRQGAA